MPEDNRTGRSFSDFKHASGQWRTANPSAANPFIRSLLSYCSFKRSGVAALSKKVRARSQDRGAGALVIDLGAGQGAYAHWFLGGRTGDKVCIVAIDWSREALGRMGKGRGKLVKLCADAAHLPIKPESADALFSVDMLGHVENITGVLDEILRIVKPGAPLFLNSECGNYRNRWPDTMLMKRIGHDFLARYDDHLTLLPYATLRSLFGQRFHIDSILSAAGLTGWLTGYPEKYRLAFSKARAPVLAAVTAIFSLLKKMPVTGVPLRLLNASINHLELALGLEGGGSCCAHLHKPMHTDPPPGDRKDRP